MSIEDEILEVVNTPLPRVAEGSPVWILAVLVFGAFSLFSPLLILGIRSVLSPSPAAVLDWVRDGFHRIFSSTLLTRICLVSALLITPLAFYLSTKSFFLVPKQTVLAFLALLGLASWLVVRPYLRAFHTPYAWPVSLILIAGAASLIKAPNLAEGTPSLFNLFGLAGFLFLASQVLSTRKSIHLVLVSILTSSVCVSFFGLAQAYYLLPFQTPLVAPNTRVPMSTLDTTDFGAAYLLLALPISLGLAIGGRSPGGRLSGLLVYFICRWHFVLCHSRGATTSLVLGVCFVGFLLYRLQPRGLKTVFVLVLLEPVLWASMQSADLSIPQLNRWGLNTLSDHGLRGTVADSVKELRGDDREMVDQMVSRSILLANERFLGIGNRFIAFILGVIVGLGLFGLLVRWRIRPVGLLIAAIILAVSPFALMLGTFPASLNTDEAVQLFNEAVLVKHREAGAFASLTLFLIMATFLLIQSQNKKADEKNIPLVAASVGVWFLFFLFLSAGENSFVQVLGRLIKGLSHAWVFDVTFIQERNLFLKPLFTVGAFAVFSLIGLVFMSKAKCWERFHTKAITGPIDGELLTRFLASAALLGVLLLGLAWNFLLHDPGDYPRNFWRRENHSASLRKIKGDSNWILGIGSGNYKIVHPHPQFETQLERRILGREALARHAGNEFLHQAVEHGILGFLGGVWLSLVAFKLLLRSILRLENREAHRFDRTLVWSMTASMTAFFFQLQWNPLFPQPASALMVAIFLGTVFQLDRMARKGDWIATG